MTSTTTNGGRREDVGEIALRRSAYEHHCSKFTILTLNLTKTRFSISLERNQAPKRGNRIFTSDCRPYCTHCSWSTRQTYQMNYARKMHGDAMCANRASFDTPCSVNATFARKRERSPQVLIIQESTEKKNPSVRYFPRAQKVWKRKREPQIGNSSYH